VRSFEPPSGWPVPDCGGLLAFGLGASIRRTAGALSGLFGVLFAMTALTDLLPTGLRNDVIKFMPANAGRQINTVQPSGNTLSPWTGLGVLALYAAVARCADSSSSAPATPRQPRDPDRLVT